VFRTNTSFFINFLLNSKHTDLKLKLMLTSFIRMKTCNKVSEFVKENFAVVNKFRNVLAHTMSIILICEKLSFKPSMLHHFNSCRVYT